jgi:hypothetical protein
MTAPLSLPSFRFSAPARAGRRDGELRHGLAQQVLPVGAGDLLEHGVGELRT